MLNFFFTYCFLFHCWCYVQMHNYSCLLLFVVISWWLFVIVRCFCHWHTLNNYLYRILILIQLDCNQIVCRRFQLLILFSWVPISGVFEALNLGIFLSLPFVSGWLVHRKWTDHMEFGYHEKIELYFEPFHPTVLAILLKTFLSRRVDSNLHEAW